MTSFGEHTGETTLNDLIKHGTLNEAAAIKILYGVLGYMIEMHTMKKAIGGLNPLKILVDSVWNVKLVEVSPTNISDGMDRESVQPDHYMAPEQYKDGKCDPKSDVFSFGVIVYQMLIGYLPFDNQEQKIRGEYKQIPDGIEPFICEMMIKMIGSYPMKMSSSSKLLNDKKEYSDINYQTNWKIEKKN